jgi:uncharacterized protein (TIGR03435 family)
LPLDQIVGGPRWMSGGGLEPSDSYVIDATMPPATTKEQFQSMLQNLLMERFHLIVHREVRKYLGYDLVLAKGGPKLKQTSAAAVPTAMSDANSRKIGVDGFPLLPPGPRTVIMPVPGGQRVKYQDRSMAEFVYNLRFRIGLAVGESQWTGNQNPRVRDRTGLTGRYDFVLEFACQRCTGGLTGGPTGQGLPEPLVSNRQMGGADQQDSANAVPETQASELPSIFVAVEKQLGLKLVKVKDIPLDVIVVDHVEKIPAKD